MDKEAADCKQANNENKEVTCSVTVDGQEKQEFSFRLYEFDTREQSNKQDMEKIVIRSICESLSKTLKLPSFGNRTIKVKLAISPENSRGLNLDKSVICQAECQNMFPSKQNDYDSSKSANTTSTYLLSSTADKPNTANMPQNLFKNNLPVSDLLAQNRRPMSSPKVKPARHSRLASLQRQEVRQSIVTPPETNQGKWVSPEEQELKSPNPEYIIRRPQTQENQDGTNYHLDSVIKENGTNISFQENIVISQITNPHYVCPYKIFDRPRVNAKSQKTIPLPYGGHPLVSNLAEVPAEKHEEKRKTSNDTHDDILNLNLDLCDIAPGAKFDWERVSSHQRSKSYDIQEPAIRASLNSPKIKLKYHSSRVAPETLRNNVNMSPSHHIRQRDQDRVRAMQQVASWINRGHVEAEKLAETNCENFIKGQPGKQEHRHLHEHVHHHYHHFVEF